MFLGLAVILEEKQVLNETQCYDEDINYTKVKAVVPKVGGGLP